MTKTYKAYKSFTYGDARDESKQMAVSRASKILDRK